MAELTLDRLRAIMREAAGEDEGVDLDGDIGDTEFVELGYDSLALLETAARVGREFAVALPDDAVLEIETPRQLLDLVNGALAGAA